MVNPAGVAIRSSALFTYTGRTLAAEASTLEFPPGNVPQALIVESERFMAASRVRETMFRDGPKII